ncbi:SRPBCC domain-containing protein [Chitinophaga sp. OAE865]|uniref:SRPBCC family protein n=1 Tax=Chitinophaga sp. OAE865 TaxID=2817898 RepID=UPI001AE25721
MEEVIGKQISINAPVARVWHAITDVGLMTAWMGGPELELEVATTWVVGAPIVISGFHHARFENKGTVLEYLPEQVVSYNFLSSISRLPDSAENYSIIRFMFEPQGEQTLLSLTITNFPTATIYHHLNFYWNTTMVMIKKMIEGMMQDNPCVTG